MFLLEYVTKVKYSEYESSPYLPWHYPDKIIDTTRHVSAITYPATKFVPFDLIDRNGCVYKDDLISIIRYVNEYLKQHKGEIKEQIKEMEKNTEIEKSTHGKVVIGEHFWG